VLPSTVHVPERLVPLCPNMSVYSPLANSPSPPAKVGEPEVVSYTPAYFVRMDSGANEELAELLPLDPESEGEVTELLPSAPSDGFPLWLAGSQPAKMAAPKSNDNGRASFVNLALMPYVLNRGE
jgi:hypothetical protein